MITANDVTVTFMPQPIRKSYDGESYGLENLDHIYMLVAILSKSIKSMPV